MLASNGASLLTTILTRPQARRDQLGGRIQERYGIARDEADRQIDGWLARDDDYWSRNNV